MQRDLTLPPPILYIFQMLISQPETFNWKTQRINFWTYFEVRITSFETKMCLVWFCHQLNLNVVTLEMPSERSMFMPWDLHTDVRGATWPTQACSLRRRLRTKTVESGPGRGGATFDTEGTSLCPNRECRAWAWLKHPRHLSSQCNGYQGKHLIGENLSVGPGPDSKGPISSEAPNWDPR